MNTDTPRHYPTSESRPERRKQRRKSALWPAQLAASAGSFECRIQNLSLRGAMVRIDPSVRVEGPVTLTLDPSTEYWGVVKWQRNGCIGIRIKEQRTSTSQIALPVATLQ